MDNYKKLVRILKKHYQLAYPVSIRRLKIDSKKHGDTVLHKKQFFIRISNEVCEDVAINTLIHEIAHARCWNHLHDSVDAETLMSICHGPEWGIAYAEAYRIYEEYLT